MARRRAEVDDEDDTPKRRRPAPVDDDEDDEAPRKTSGENAYTGLLGITLAALIGAAVFFYLDHEAMTSQTVSPPTVNVPPLGGQAPAAGAAGNTTQG